MIGARQRRTILLSCLLLFSSLHASAKDSRILVGGFPRRYLDDSTIKLIQDNFKLFTEYVSQRVGKEIVLEPVGSLDELRGKLNRRELDFTWAWTPLETMRILREYPLTPFVTINPVGGGASKGFRHLLITRADNGCGRLEDARGKNLLSLNSEDGLYKDFSLLFVELLLKRRGQDIKKFFRLSHYSDDKFERSNTVSLEYGRSKNLILKVLSDPNVVASVQEEAYLLMARRNPKIEGELCVIAASEPFPPMPYLVWQDSDPQVLRKIKTALLDMSRNPEGEEILRSVRIRAWKDVNVGDYNALVSFVEEAKRLGVSTLLSQF